MPRKQEHDAFERMILGYVTGMTDLMDAPAQMLKHHHRALFHDFIQINALAIAMGGNYADNLVAGMIHVLLDDAVSSTKHTLNEIGRKNKKSGGNPQNNYSQIKQIFDTIFGGSKS